MSIRPGLLASTSRLTLATLQTRAASTKAPTSTPGAKGSVEAADEEVAKKRAGASRRLPAGLDLNQAYMSQLMDPEVIPKFQWSWLKNLGFYPWAWSLQGRRFFTTRKAIKDLADKHILLPEAGKINWFRGWSPRFYARPLVEELTTIYKNYNIAQAKGDFGGLRVTSAAKALAQATTAARAIGDSGNQWRITRENAAPFLLSARHNPLDPNSTVCVSQVVIRFDYDQTLTRKGVPKTMRVVENVLFYRGSDRFERWKIIGKVDLTQPPFLLK